MIDRVVIRGYIIAITLMLFAGGWILVAANPFPSAPKLQHLAAGNGPDQQSVLLAARAQLRIRHTLVERAVARRKAVWRRARSARLREIAAMQQAWTTQSSYAAASMSGGVSAPAYGGASIPAMTISPSPPPASAPVSAGS